MLFLERSSFRWKEKGQDSCGGHRAHVPIWRGWKWVSDGVCMKLRTLYPRQGRCTQGWNHPPLCTLVQDEDLMAMYTQAPWLHGTRSVVVEEEGLTVTGEWCS